MRRATFDDSADASSAPIASSNYAPCRSCHGSTPKAMLVQYGAMCHTCFEGYCREGSTPIRGTLNHGDKRAILERMRSLVKPGVPTRKWAEKLRDSEKAGARLTPAQKTAWRSALGVYGSQPTFDAETGEEVAWQAS